MDFFYWGGPVYCKQAHDLVWQRPTKVFCNPREGSSNGDYFYSLGSDPMGKLLQKSGVSPESVGSVGFGGFSAFHQFLNPLLKIPSACERVDYVHLADSCFLGAGATTAHSGYVAFAKRAAAGKARMTVTTNGPWGKDISYSGPAGSKYEGTQFNLTSGAKCFELVWREAAGDLSGDAEVPAGIPIPSRVYRKGELYWFHYEAGLSDPHGDHANKLAQPYMQMYGVPWMGGDRPLGLTGDAMPWVIGGIFAALGWLGVRWYLGKSARPNALADRLVYAWLVSGPLEDFVVLGLNQDVVKKKASSFRDENDAKMDKLRNVLNEIKVEQGRRVVEYADEPVSSEYLGRTSLGSFKGWGLDIASIARDLVRQGVSVQRIPNME